jgi:hypothetical protein
MEKSKVNPEAEKVLQYCEEYKKRINAYEEDLFDYVYVSKEEFDPKKIGGDIIAVLEEYSPKEAKTIPIDYMIWSGTECGVDKAVIFARYINGFYLVFTGAPLRPTFILYEGRNFNEAFEAFKGEWEEYIGFEEVEEEEEEKR